MNPTKTFYMVYYRATDGSGYRWSDEALTRDLGEDIVEAREPVKRWLTSVPQSLQTNLRKTLDTTYSRRAVIL